VDKRKAFFPLTPRFGKWLRTTGVDEVMRTRLFWTGKYNGKGSQVSKKKWADSFSFLFIIPPFQSIDSLMDDMIIRRFIGRSRDNPLVSAFGSG
jgi:hypothetical protein